MRVGGDRRQLHHPVVFAAFHILDQDRRAIAVAALLCRIGAEIDLAGNHALEVTNADKRFADAVRSAASDASVSLGERGLNDQRRLIKVMVGDIAKNSLRVTQFNVGGRPPAITRVPAI
jgi:hypothetical protein